MCTNRCNCGETFENTEVGDDEAEVWDDCNGDSSNTNSIDEEEDKNEFN